MTTDQNKQDTNLPDLSLLSEDERSHVLIVMKRAKDFEKEEEQQSMRQHIEGVLHKYTNVVKGWQFRFFTLDPDLGKIEYYEKAEHKGIHKPRGSLSLAGAVISPSDEDSQTFTINAANSEIYKLRALNAKERQHWVNRLRATSEYHTASIGQNAPPLSKDGRTHSYGSSNQFSIALPNSHSNSGSQEIYGTTKTKHNVFPVHNESFQMVKEKLLVVRGHQLDLSRTIEDIHIYGDTISQLDKELLILKATSSATLECLQKCLSILQQQQQQQYTSNPSSHRSSHSIDGRNLFEDHSNSASEILLSSNPMIVDGKEETTLKNDTLSLTTTSVQIKREEEVEDVEEYNDTNLEAIDEHKSVILHLLSQLKLGMDLTKVVLPTFILERRSLLEMFADCMAHPDKFLSIPDQDDAEQRFIAVLEWYLTSFHASRKGDIAKKPFNPIIGETFHCSWRVNREQISSHSKNAQKSEVESGYISNSEESSSGLQNGKSHEETTQNVCDNKSDCDDEEVFMSFCGEQVSHHPPISAMYFECPQKQMSMQSSIWTKSKFMGMSIGATMVGQVKLNLLSHDEEYVFSLPSAYARSILTIPWVELGDRIVISCQKTGYSATIVFHTKPFYGGKTNLVTAEMKSHPLGDIMLRVKGYWNGQLEFTYSDGNSYTIDTTKQVTKLKWVRPIKSQSDFESRRLWQNVIKSLQQNDVDTATEHKHFLEEQQRSAEKHRKETGIKYVSQYFDEESEGVWHYKSPLKES